jgi:P27 family predicted phage terminase small subunit
VKKPTPPKHLSAEAKRLWANLRSEFTIDDSAGLLLLQNVCEAYDRLQDARAIIKREGLTVTDRFGQSKQHPAILTEAGARQQLYSGIRALRLETDTDLAVS